MSSFKSFASVYKKDLVAGKRRIGLVLILLGILFVYLNYKMHTWTEPSLALPFAVIPLVVLPWGVVVLGFLTLRSEWAENTHYLLMSIPFHRGVFVGAKFLAVITEFIILTAVAAAGAFWVLNSYASLDPRFWAGLEPYIQAMGGRNQFIWQVFSLGLKFYVLYVLSMAFMLATIFAAYLAGKTVHRYGWLVTGTVFLGILYLPNPIRNWLLFAFGPIKVELTHSFLLLPSPYQWVDISSFVATSIVAVLALVATLVLAERYVEV